MEMFKRAWRGEEKLWKVFWIYGVIIGTVIGAIIDETIAHRLTGLAIQSPYIVWNLVSCWRCAFNARAKFWGVLVRILIVIYAIACILAVIGFGLGADYSSRKPSTTSQLVNAAKCNAAMRKRAEAAGVDVKQFNNEHLAEKERCLKEGLESMGWDKPQQSSSYVVPATLDACEQRMHDFAVQNNTDPASYIAQNQAYLNQCRAALVGQQLKP